MPARHADQKVVGIWQINYLGAARGRDTHAHNWRTGGIDLQTNRAAETDNSGLELEVGLACEPGLANDESPRSVIKRGDHERASLQIQMQILDADLKHGFSDGITIRIDLGPLKTEVAAQVREAA